MKQPLRKKIATWVYQGNHELIESSSRNSMDFFIIQSILGSIIMTLLGGQFLTGYALYLGASDESVGYISLIGSISGSFVIFAGLFLERFKTRRKLVVVLNTILKPLLISAILIPLFIPKNMQVLALFVILTFAYALNSMMNIAINNWFVSVIPMNIRGQYYSTRQIYAVAVSAVIPIIAGRIMDTAVNPYTGFSILYVWAFIFVWAENYAFAKIDDVEIDNTGNDKLKIRDVFRVPIKNKEFVKYTFKMVAFHFVLYLSASLTQAYMLKYMGLSYTFISSMTVMSSLIQMVVYPRWGRIGDKRGHKWAMRISMWFYVAQMGLWAFVTKGNMYFLIPIIHLISAIGGPGFAVSTFTVRYEVIPEKGFTLYDGFYSAVLGLTLMAAPWVGSQIRQELANIQAINNVLEFGELRIMFAVSALGILLLQLYDVIKRRIRVKDTGNVVKIDG